MSHLSRSRWSLVAAMALVLAAGCAEDRPAPTLTTTPLTPEAAIDLAMDSGLDLYRAQCAVCHGELGEGGIGQDLRAPLLATFSSCGDQIDFVTVGTDEWPESTYGDNATPLMSLGTAMPGFGVNLEADDIAAVNFWVRVELAGIDADAAAVDCGITAP